eukprot:352223-Chlamydomonas_euryale.AAC.7
MLKSSFEAVVVPICTLKSVANFTRLKTSMVLGCNRATGVTVRGRLCQPLVTHLIASTQSRYRAVVQPPTLVLKCAAALISASANQIPASRALLSRALLNRALFEPSTSEPDELDDDAKLTWGRFRVCSGVSCIINALIFERLREAACASTASALPAMRLAAAEAKATKAAAAPRRSASRKLPPNCPSAWEPSC